MYGQKVCSTEYQNKMILSGNSACPVNLKGYRDSGQILPEQNQTEIKQFSYQCDYHVIIYFVNLSLKLNNPL
jgi:hypothetical protein